jgi:hypothetical protein
MIWHERQEVVHAIVRPLGWVDERVLVRSLLLANSRTRPSLNPAKHRKIRVVNAEDRASWLCLHRVTRVLARRHPFPVYP